ncbi:MAG: NAD(+) synthase [Gammaproteobacteria bacterium]|nr:NAD(+) synthase [Gammaproteobacteria bacterium]
MENIKKIEYICKWITDYVDTMPVSAKSLIVGISGGIDSSLTSTLCAKTGIHTIAVKLPISSDNPKNCDLHATWLINNFKNVQCLELNLTNIYSQFKKICDEHQLHNDLGLANSKARLRMLALYQIAASTNGLVIGTGNKVEDFGVGFFTKYGDGGVDISPIADLKKSEVKNLAKELKIHKSIIDANPTDGLWDDGRTDEDQLGLTYDQIEDAMSNNDSPHKSGYEKIRNKNLHKMKPIPVCKFEDE